MRGRFPALRVLLATGCSAAFSSFGGDCLIGESVTGFSIHDCSTLGSAAWKMFASLVIASSVVSLSLANGAAGCGLRKASARSRAARVAASF